MTSTPLSASLDRPRSPWRSLLWIAPLTAVWIALIDWQPGIVSSGVPVMALQLMVHGLIAMAVWIGLDNTDLTPGQRRVTWLALLIPYTLWMAISWSAAIHGVFRLDTSTPSLPLLPMAIFLPVIIGAPLLLRSRRVGMALDAIPATWLVAVQIYRIFGAWALAAWMHDALPGVFALPAGIGDVLTGLCAVPVAMAIASGTSESRKAAILWNVFGLVDFALAVTMGMLTSPGRLQLIVPDVQSIGAGAYPGVLTPAFVVPSSILLHALSLRQLMRRRVH